ncbi:MopE-related protein [Corallococcus sp. RDP092CA]|uniref:MopE-related protein n=1 Tax=Corallococcus sp. RDP092CA TaxID=3109369 RepID=UPI0035ADE8AA
MKRLLLMLPLLALAGCKDPKDGVKVIISYGQFVPGCVRVTATDTTGKNALTTDVAVREKNADPNGEIVVGVLVPTKWGTTVSIEANAYEALPQAGTCTGTPVRNNKQGITVPKGSGKEGKTPELRLRVDAPDEDRDGYVSTLNGGSDCDDTRPTTNPGAKELCNGRDDNCGGDIDEGFQLGEVCINESNGCAGTYQCGSGNDPQRECATPEAQPAWADEDRDGHGDPKRDNVFACTLLFPENRLPTSAPRDDCDDTRGTVYLGAPEICDELDNDCDDDTDEGLDLGEPCTDPTYRCDNATTQCNFDDGGTLCQPPPMVPTWYPDEDKDSFGRTDAGVVYCPQPDAGYIRTPGDCNDGNPFTHAEADELCDGQDNNCNGLSDTDEGICGTGTDAGPSWNSTTVGDGGTAWRSIALMNDGGVWLVGGDSTRAVKPSTPSDFSMLPGFCTATPQAETRDLFSVWADTRTGTAYIGGQGNNLIIQKADSESCAPRKPPEAEGTTQGLMGFNLQDGGVEILGVTSRSNTSGGSFTWDGGLQNVTVTQYDDNSPLRDVHGLSPELTFAVGGTTGQQPRIRKHVPGEASWQPVSGLPTAGALWAVKVVNDKLAYAVGEQATLLRWDGNTDTWTKEQIPNADTDEVFTGVLAFGRNSIYISTDKGNVYQFDGTSWLTHSFITALYDIEGSNPGNIWTVGNFGRVIHFPVAPVPQ